MNLFEIKYNKLLDLTRKQRYLMKKMAKWPNSDDTKRLYQINYQIDDLLKKQEIEDTILQTQLQKAEN